MRKSGSSPLVPRPGEGKRGAEGYLGYLLRQGSAAYRLKVERALADLRVTPPQFALLTMLVAYPGLSGAELARLALLTPQTVSVILANLERDGLVARRRHAAHGRIRHVDVTASGRALLARWLGPDLRFVCRDLAAMRWPTFRRGKIVSRRSRTSRSPAEARHCW